MKKVLLTVCFFAFAIACLAQDIITTRDKKKINAQIIEVSGDYIKFKYYNDLNGPVSMFQKKDVISIRYYDGRIEQFQTNNSRSPLSGQTQNQTQTQTQTQSQTQSQPQSQTQPQSQPQSQPIKSNQTIVIANSSNLAKCPFCYSTSLSTNRRGFKIGTAVVWGLLVPGFGIIAGFIGSNKIIITCMQCGRSWKAR